MPKDTNISQPRILSEGEKLQLSLIKSRRERLDAKAIAAADKMREKREADKAAGIVRRAKKPERFELNPDFPPVSFLAGRILRPFQELEAALVKAEHKPSKRSRKTSKKTGELPLDNIELTPPPTKDEERLVKVRVQCRNTVSFLEGRSDLEADIVNPLSKAAHKISNCSIWGLFQSINQQVNYKIGTALCKSRLCPNCQRVLSAKRRNNFLQWFELNREELSGYFFYHMVLTVRHSAAEGVRTGLYTPDMLAYFAELRGTSGTLSGAKQRERSRIWKEFVAGGSYSVEVKAGTDGSPHIHIHCLLIGRKQLHNAAKDSKFLQYVKPLWKSITGDSTGVFVAPVYFLDENREPVYCSRGTDVNIASAVAECMKYTIKADAHSLGAYSNEFLADLLTMRNRYYARFGCLHSRDEGSKQFKQLDMLCTDYQDLEQLTRAELNRLFDPETGELVDKENTSIVATPFRNMAAKPGVIRLHDEEGQLVEPARGESLLGGETYYEMLPCPAGQRQFFPYHERQTAATFLSKSVRGEYDEALELPGVLAPQVKRKAAPMREASGVNNFRYHDDDPGKPGKIQNIPSK